MSLGSADGPKLPPTPAGDGADDVWEEPATIGDPKESNPASPSELTSLEPALRAAHTDHLESYSDLYGRRRAATPDSKRWAAAGAAALVAGPFAIFAAFFGQFAGVPRSVFGLVAVVLLAPAAEELLKAAGALFLAEQRPWYVPAAWTLVAVTLVSGLVFAAIENLIYLNVYIPDPSPEIARWRWIAGPLLHGGASLIAGLGVARMWLATDVMGQPPSFRLAAPFLTVAIALHASYNATVVVLEATGAIF